MMDTYTCTKCGEAKPAEAFTPAHRRASTGRGRCKPCNAESHKAWRANLSPKQRSDFDRRHHLKGNYGITPEQAEGLRAMGCAICGAPTGGRWDTLAIDHNKETGEVRGPLCSEHNQGIGKFNHDPEMLRRAADYLELPSLLGAL